MDNRLASLTMMEMFHTHNNPSLLSSFVEWLNREQNQIVTLLDEKHNIVFISYSVKAILGYSYDQMLDKKICHYIHPDHQEKFYEFLASLDEHKKTLEFSILHKERHYIDAHSYAGRIFDEQSNEYYYIVCIEDYTQHKKAQEALSNSEKLSSVGQLAASVVHEIRNPLTSIKGFLQLIKNSNGTMHDEYFRVMTESIEKIESITSELLYISKPSPNKMQNENIVSIVKEVCLLMRSQAIMSNINLKFASEVNRHEVNCDRSQMKQVLINLIKNAIEAMKEQGTIKVIIRKDDRLFIDVIDQGVGVPDDIKEKLGSPFFTTKENGTGLGLMVTKNILRNHNCELSIHDNFGGGSIFRISFSK